MQFIKSKKIVAVITSLCLVFSIAIIGWDDSIVFATEGTSDQPYAEGEVIVVFEDDVNKKEAAEITDELGAEDMEVLDAAQDNLATVVTIPEKEDVEEAVGEYSDDPDVAYAQPNYRYELSETKQMTTKANDAARGELWHFDTIQVEDAWDLLKEQQHEKTRVAVLDSGVQLNHPDLKSNLNTSLCKDTSSGISTAALTGDPNGHGTHVAGIIAATTNNSTGVAGVGTGTDNSLVELFAVNVFSGAYAYTDGIVRGIEYATTQNAKVINMSLGYANPGALDWEDQYLKSAIDTATGQNVTVVCAAGNENSTVPTYPADFSNAISVIATNNLEKRASFSNYGSTKNISAPGENILSTYKNSQYAWADGTSMAAPVVSGVAAMIYAVKPNSKPADVKNVIFETATDLDVAGKDKYTGYGNVNANLAIRKTQGLTCIKLRPTFAKQNSSFALPYKTLSGKDSSSTIEWKSSNKSIAEVNKGGTAGSVQVTTHLPGQANIMAIVDGKVAGQCTVRVWYDLNYVLNKGKNNSANPSVYYKTKVNFKNPTRRGYTFLGWYKESSFTNKVSSVSSGNHTIYAKWQKVTVSKTSITKITKPSSTKRKVTYKKVSGAKGYQIAYSTSKKFTKKTTKFKNTTSRAKTLTKLKKGKRYYIKVRAYKLDSCGNKVYGKYSKVKSK